MLGYMTGFTSEAKPVSAFRPIKLVKQRQFIVQSTQVSTRLNSERSGLIAIDLQLQCLATIPIKDCLLVVDKEADSKILSCPVNIHMVDGLVRCV